MAQQVLQDIRNDTSLPPFLHGPFVGPTNWTLSPFITAYWALLLTSGPTPHDQPCYIYTSWKMPSSWENLEMFRSVTVNQ